jgi:hypothetical protein
LKKPLFLLVISLAASLIDLSCGATPSSSSQTSGIKYRAFISNNVSAGSASAGLYIVDAQNDIRGNVAPITAGAAPGMMVVTPNRAQTLVFSGTGTASSDNTLYIINNASEKSAGSATLNGMTESFIVSPDSSTVYVAVPTAQVVGQDPGVVQVITLGSGFSGQVPVPAVHYLSMNHSGTRILGFSDNLDSITVITPSLIQTGGATATVCCFNRPVMAFFSSDDTTAYIVNCGPECGGSSQASIQTLDLTTNTAGATPVNVPAASIGLLDGSTLYLAGTPYSVGGGGPSSPCLPAGTTQAQYCGALTIFDLNTMLPTNTAPIPITDGYHNRIALAANGQLFIGARTCTEIVPPVPTPPGAEIRGCLSIYNTLSSAVGSVPAGGVVIPPETGDVTGIQPIATRNVVYVIQGQNVQGGSLYIYSTATDALQPNQITNLVGGFVDVKTVDF